jgi:hypothetical protein
LLSSKASRTVSEIWDKSSSESSVNIVEYGGLRRK